MVLGRHVEGGHLARACWEHFGARASESALGCGDGGGERFRFQGNSRVTTLWALPRLRWNSGEEHWFGSQKSYRVSVWLNLLAAK